VALTLSPSVSMSDCLTSPLSAPFFLCGWLPGITVSMTQAKKKGREGKESLVEQIRESVDSFPHVYVFAIENVRNSLLKDIRTEQKDSSRFFMGKNKVMALALGTSSETEYRDNLHKISTVWLLTVVPPTHPTP